MPNAQNTSLNAPYKTKKSTVIKAQGEAQSAELIGSALKNNPTYIYLRQLEAAKDIASTMSKSENKLYIDSDTLLLNVSEARQSVIGAK